MKVLAKIDIIIDDFLKIDLSYACPYIPTKYLHFFFGGHGQSPYRLLAYLSTFFANSTFIEIGVHNGWGSLALSYNRANRIIGYDIDLSTLDSNIKKIPQLSFREGLAHELDPNIILNSPLIHLDALHDGVYEQTFFDFLVKNNYRGFLILDDIHLNKEMKSFWGSINVTKYDLTNLGHSTGTGLVCFNGAKLDILRNYIFES
jgi:hypothetical protein